MMRFFVILLLLISLFGCKESSFRKGKFFAGNKYVSADTLNLGKSTYMEYCFACHGVNGDGQGVAAKGLYPPVRDFTQGVYKFGKVLDGELPHDEDLIELVKNGLNGTPMLKWDISDQRADAVVQYIKTFAPKVWEGKDKELGKKVVLSKDPFGIAHKGAAIAKGKAVYHFVANCNSCHRGYLSKDEYNELAPKYESEKVDSFEEEYFAVKPQDSDYGAKIIPPEFTWHEVRSAQTVDELAIRIGAGVTGVMPTWKDIITDEEIWAVAYYVKSLMDLKDTPRRKEIMSKIK